MSTGPEPSEPANPGPAAMTIATPANEVSPPRSFIRVSTSDKHGPCVTISCGFQKDAETFPDLQLKLEVVAVSDEAGSGVIPATAAGRFFRDQLGLLNQRLAAESEETVLVVAGRVIALPG